jgi:hypothetical protein
MAVNVRDKSMESLAVMFYDAPQDPTPDVQALSKEKLDFSIESLSHVEEYLDVVRKQKHTGKPLHILVLRAGGYVGEVIRRHAKHKRWHWLDYAEAGKLDPDIVPLGKTIHTAAILWDAKKGGGRFVFPLGKVMKYLQNGQEDSVKFFAEVIINTPDSPNNALEPTATAP